MLQKHAILVAVAVVGIGIVFALVYQQFQTPVSAPSLQSSKTSVSERAEQALVPETIDDISESIQEEASLDLSALDAEEAGEVEDIETDSDSINNLGTSYDESNL